MRRFLFSTAAAAALALLTASPGSAKAQYLEVSPPYYGPTYSYYYSTPYAYYGTPYYVTPYSYYTTPYRSYYYRPGYWGYYRPGYRYHYGWRGGRYWRH